MAQHQSVTRLERRKSLGGATMPCPMLQRTSQLRGKSAPFRFGGKLAA